MPEIGVEQLRPHTEYRPCELSWLENVPNSLAGLRAKYLFREIDIESVSGEVNSAFNDQTRGLIESAKNDSGGCARSLRRREALSG